MPELPEVETIRRGLKSVIVGKTVTGFENRDAKVVKFQPEEIVGSKIESIDRRAKILVIRLTSAVIPDLIGNPKKKEEDKTKPEEKVILCHLKMTGQLIWEASPGSTDFALKKSRSTSLTAGRVAGGHPGPGWVEKLPNAYTRAIFHFDDGSVLFFNDLRRFGYMKIYDSKDLNELTELKKLGPEPFDSSSGQALQPNPEFSVDYLMRRAAKIPNRKIKQFITDQEVISGVGNIYVDEALFYAKIHPLRLVRDIKLSEWEKIRESILKALEFGIKYGGSSEDTYVDVFGNQGTMNDHTNVYRHTGADCPAGCGGQIERITLGGRGTHFCPACQH